jgi:hypothetical protein
MRKYLKGYTPPENPGVELEFHKKIVFCKKENVYWDLSTWDEYKEKAIDQTFQHLFKQKPSLIYSKNPDKLIVESTVFRPDLYTIQQILFLKRVINFILTITNQKA